MPSATLNPKEMKGAPFFRVLCGRLGDDNPNLAGLAPMPKRNSESQRNEGWPILPRSLRKSGRR